MRTTKETVNEIKSSLTQRSSSHKDEIAVMQAMLNDKDYKVDIYGGSGKTGVYCPSEDARSLTASLLVSTTKISRDEAEHLAGEHEFSKAESGSFINIGKEFIHTYAETGRKLPLGGRAESNISLMGKDVEASVSRYPKKIVDGNGNVSYQNAEKKVPAHKSIKVTAPCPTWVQ